MASNLRVDNIQPSTGMGIGIGTANGSVTITGDLSVDTSKGLTVGTGATISGGTNYITASTNGSERLRIDSSGNVGIGTDIPVTSFGYSNLSLANNSGGQIELKRLSSGPNVHYIWGDNHLNIAASYSGSSGDIVFKANGNNERFRVGADGNLQIANGNLVFSTAGTGIDFSANSNAGGMTSELLDDYEEGTFTPRISVENQGSDAAIDNTSGTYVKVGQLVHCTFNADLNGIPAGRGTSFAWQWGGLPFTSRAEGSEGSEDYIGSVRISGADHTSTYGVAAEFILRMFDNGTGGRIEVMRVSNGDIVNASLYMKDNTTITGSITYRAL